MNKVVVYIPGVWDLLHVGHILILERAKALGDILIVGVPIDAVVVEDKGKNPIIPCDQRIKMLESLKCVDLAIPYEKLDFVTALKRYKVDVLVIGTQWGTEKRHIQAEEYMRLSNGKIVQFPYSNEISTTKIIDKILEDRSKI